MLMFVVLLGLFFRKTKNNLLPF